MEEIVIDAENKVIFNDPEDKLYKIGFQDGETKTKKNIEKNLPTDMDFLNPRGPKRYIEGFIAGSESALNKYEENQNQPKTR